LYLRMGKREMPNVLPSEAVTTLEAARDRASSDYIAVSRSGASFDPDGYQRAEEAAWARLVAAVEALAVAGLEPTEKLVETAEASCGAPGIEDACTASK
jgi:hypothetical protein